MSDVNVLMRGIIISYYCFLLLFSFCTMLWLFAATKDVYN